MTYISPGYELLDKGNPYKSKRHLRLEAYHCVHYQALIHFPLLFLNSLRLALISVFIAPGVNINAFDAYSSGCATSPFL
jgi:hypothetical protein